MGKWKEEDTAKATDSTIKEVKQTWHQARDDSPDTVERSIHKLEEETQGNTVEED